MPRVMCVHFPSWNLQRIQQQRPEFANRPLAITRPVANKGFKVIACCSKAYRRGVRVGMVQAEALATVPALTCVAEDLDADRQALTQLAEWSQRFSPIVGIEDVIAPSCIFLDTSGCADCFGGEETLLGRVCAEFREVGWVISVALADTLGAAWAASHFPRSGDSCFLFAHDEHQAHLADLPIAALRLSAEAESLLGQLGIERIAQLIELPRNEVAERFGREIGWRLDQALGRSAEVITPLHGQPEAAASWAFEEPVERHDIVLRALDILLERLQAILEKRHTGTRLVECVFELDGAEPQRFECSLSRPARTAGYLRSLLQTRLEQFRVRAPIRAMSVRAVVLERMLDEQGSLFADSVTSAAELAHLLDSLVARLGRDAVSTPRFVADAQPERACRFDCALEDEPKKTDVEALPVFVHRPLRMFARPLAIEVIALMPCGTPERIRHADADEAVAHCQGPERIETGWWRSDDIRRDYYVVETKQGTRWWIFQRVEDGRWFLHGCFD